MTEKQPPHVEQALAELAGTTNEDQRRAARKRLAATGYEEAAQARAADMAEGDTDRKATPKGRATRQEAKGSTA
jgi:hypothetical protein